MREKGETGGRIGMGRLLLGWVVGEVYALCDVALQAFYAGLE
jgi:hypothetical protein